MLTTDADIIPIVTSAFDLLSRAYPSGSGDEIAEAIQEASLLYLSNAPEGVRRDVRKAICWMLTVSRRVLGRERRRRSRFEPLTDSEESSHYVAGRDTADHLVYLYTTRKLLSGLHPAQADAVWLHAVEKCKPAEIADLLGCSVNAVKHRLKRAYPRLRKALGNDRRM